MTTENRYVLQRYLLMTLDPLHPGAGGYRLGRVDNSIIREPGTRLPKIPGTSLHGAARAYAAYLNGTPEAAGQSQDKVKNPDQNPVCYTFGYIQKDKGDNVQSAHSGVVSVFDAHILLFPVHSLAGPVWVSTPSRLKEAGFDVTNAPHPIQEDTAWLTWDHKERLNLGWLMFNAAGPAQVAPPPEWGDDPRWAAIRERLVLVADSIFGHIVNSNLEVRTSVSIDPYTGAAAEGALFTYEALPRATFLTMEVVLDEYRQAFPQNDPGWQGPLDVVRAGLRMIEHLGVGGMGTRGFGRMAIVGSPVQKDLLKEATQEAAQ